MFILQNVSYAHPNKEMLFQQLNFSLQKGDKTALVGQNGVGKSTLLKLISSDLVPTGGQIKVEGHLHFVPQIYGQFDHLSVAECLGIDAKYKALQSILSGDATVENFEILNDDWELENRVEEAFSKWKIEDISLSEAMKNLSGGQKTKVMLAGIDIHETDLVLLDEPSNHLDLDSRKLLYDFVVETSKTLLIVSHDRRLLNLVNTVAELSSKGIQMYGGNYDFYKSQKEIADEALQNDIKNKEKSLKKAKETERESMERQQKLDARGKSKQEKSGVARIMMNTLRNKAENSSSKLKDIHAGKTESISEDLHQLRLQVSLTAQMKFSFDNSSLHRGKRLVKAENINFGYAGDALWKNPLNFEILSGDKVAIKGKNASGKSTLIKLILGELSTTQGKIFRADFKWIYLDQNYSVLQDQFSVLEQREVFNETPIPEHEVKTILNRFLFHKTTWDKTCGMLSGGERMRLLLACLCIAGKAPDMIILDEPTNNLDLENVEILTAALQDYQGTLLVISHDEQFLHDLEIEHVIEL